jgi:hypothetical protein
MKLKLAFAAAALAFGCVGAAGHASAAPENKTCTPRYETESYVVHYSNPPIWRVLVYRVDRHCRKHLVQSYLKRGAYREG